MLERQLWAVLACPDCQSGLEDRAGAASCTGCGVDYPVTGGQLDLHLRAPKRVEVPLEVRPFGQHDSHRRRRPAPIPRNPRGVVHYDPQADHEHRLWFGNGMTPELASWLPSGRGDQVLLDMGCGARRAEAVLRRTGMAYLGLDVAGEGPDVLGSAEALPIRDESVDLLFALAVLPHVPRPWLAAREVARVLRPGSLFIGTSQFLEPCDTQSRHHASALGVLDWLEDAQLEVLELEANRQWSGVRAISMMGYLPRRVRMASTFASVVDTAHRAFRAVHPGPSPAPLGEDSPERFTGGFRFIARRPV